DLFHGATFVPRLAEYYGLYR
nr:ribosomal protein MRP-L4, mitochondrial - bovine (fragments) [Bos taurus]